MKLDTIRLVRRHRFSPCVLRGSRLLEIGWFKLGARTQSHCVQWGGTFTYYKQTTKTQSSLEAPEPIPYWRKPQQIATCLSRPTTHRLKKHFWPFEKPCVHGANVAGQQHLLLVRLADAEDFSIMINHKKPEKAGVIQ